MDKMEMWERIQDLKRNFNSELYSMEDIPENLKIAVNQIMDGIIEEYTGCWCNTQGIEDELDSMKEEVFGTLRGKREEKIGIYREQINQIINKLERTIENGENIETVKIAPYLEQESNTEYAETIQIIDLVQEKLQELRRQRERRLSYSGYSDERIYQIRERIKSYISTIPSYYENAFLDFLKDDYQDWTRKVERIFEAFVAEISGKNQEEEKNYGNYEQLPVYILDTQEVERNAREKFLKRLDAGMSLEEQHQDAIDRANEKSETVNEVEPLPDHIID